MIISALLVGFFWGMEFLSQLYREYFISREIRISTVLTRIQEGMSAKGFDYHSLIR